jgi:hypothetical protein
VGSEVFIGLKYTLTPLVLPNDTEFSGERKRVRCNEWLDSSHNCDTQRHQVVLDIR